MPSLLIIAHGSRNQQSAREIETLGARIKARLSAYDNVAVCYLELAEPDIKSAISELANQGASHIDLLPYFLAQGNHVAEDIPHIVSEAADVHPDISLNLLPHLGNHPDMPDFVVNHVIRNSRSGNSASRGSSA